MTPDEVVEKLRPWANMIAARFGAPVYLVGSALDQGSDARDVDVVVVLPSDEFYARYPGAANYQSTGHAWRPGDIRWGNDCAKLGAYAGRATGFNVDFKVQASWEEDHERIRGKQKRRLDQLEVPNP